MLHLQVHQIVDQRDKVRIASILVVVIIAVNYSIVAVVAVVVISIILGLLVNY